MLSVYVCGGLLTFLSSLVLLYISLATGLGPWAGPLIVAVVHSCLWAVGASVAHKKLAKIVTVASFGGAIATGVAFSLPTLYFADPVSWQVWAQQPVYSVMALFFLVTAAALLGWAVGRQMTPGLLADKQNPFPVSAAISSAIEADQTQGEALFFAGGFLGALTLPPLVQAAALNLVPGTLVCIATGFFAGGAVINPLMVGLALRYLFVDPLYWCARWLNWDCFAMLTANDFLFAFLTGLLASGLLRSFLGPLRRLAIKRYSVASFVLSLKERSRLEWCCLLVAGAPLLLSGISIGTVACALIAIVPLLRHLGLLAVKSGLAAYGRYMTAVMIPLMGLAVVNELQVVVVCVLIGVAGAVAVDVLFSSKVGQHFHIQQGELFKLQLWGMLCAAVAVSVLFYLLSHHFVLGTAPLLAHRGLSRALLMRTFHFNGLVMLVGAAVGLVLEYCKVNSVMVFGGLIMPIPLVIALRCGAYFRTKVVRLERWNSFWSGILAGEALGVLLALVLAKAFSVLCS